MRVCVRAAHVRAGVVVDDARAAFDIAVANGGKPALPPTQLAGGVQTIAEIVLYGDVVLRLISGDVQV